tara:strand:- start:35321 stop:36415 length:1095 start_codon:yes stop_codon:yes gene_type:complete
MKKKIFIITGEESGDKLASLVFSKTNTQDYEFKAIGGQNLKNMGIPILFDNKDITYFGITDVILNIFKIFRKINFTVTQCVRFKPDLIFSVDCPDFSFRVIERVKRKINTKAYHFVAPTIWSWRERRAIKIKKIIDHIFLLFPFEKKYFDKYRINNSFVGHPFFLKFEKSDNSKKNANMISICPGSRKSEITKMLPILIKVIKKLDKNYTYHFPSTSQTYQYLEKNLKQYDFKYIISTNEKDKNYNFSKSILTIAKSGTISLDVCKNFSPLITIYKMSLLNYLLIKPFVKVKYVNIVNIIANKEVIPELIQFDCTVKKISNLANKFLSNKELLNKNVEDYIKAIGSFSNMTTDEKILNYIKKNI